MVNLEDINQTFKLPILYNRKVEQLSETIMEDLELIKTFDSNAESIFYKSLRPKNIFGGSLLLEWVKYYTTDIKFLKDTQCILKTLPVDENDADDVGVNNRPLFLEQLWKKWSTIKNDKYFKHNAGFIDFYGCSCIN